MDGFLVSLHTDVPGRMRGWPQQETVGESAVWFHGYLADPVPLRTQLKLERWASFGAIVEAGWRRWGSDIAERITGEYAAVVVSGADAVMIGDRMGLRPLYYSACSTGTAVSTDLGTLARETGAWREPDDDYLADLFSSGLHLGPRTPYRRIRRLGVGEFATWQPGRLQVRSGWRPPDEPVTGTFDEHQELLRTAVTRAVAGAVASDGAHAVELSGGLDSSTVLAVAAGMVPVRALSYVYPGSPSSDETMWIRAALETTPAPWHPIDATENGTFTAGPDFGTFLPAPSRRILNWALHTAEDSVATELGLSTILTGEGGDAVFHGGPMPWYMADLLRAAKLTRLRHESRRWSADAEPRRAAAFWVRRAAVDGVRRWRGGRTLTLEPPIALAESAPWLHRTYVESRDLQSRTRTTTAIRTSSVHGQAVLENVLRCAEFARSRHVFPSAGPEQRHPLLAPALVDLAMTTPWPIAVDPRIDRAVQRYAFTGLVSDTVLRRRSKASADEAISHGLERNPRWREYLCEKPQVAERGYVDAGAWSAAVRSFGRIGRVTQMHAAIQIEVWLRHLHHGGAPSLLTPSENSSPSF